MESNWRLNLWRTGWNNCRAETFADDLGTITLLARIRAPFEVYVSNMARGLGLCAVYTPNPLGSRMNLMWADFAKPDPTANFPYGIDVFPD